MTATLIQAVPVIRARNGEWLHPDLPAMSDDYAEFLLWNQAQGLDISYDLLRDVSGSDDYPPMAVWTPLPPPGDGWFLLFIADTEDGPACSWARHARGGQLQ